jgi:alkaline phosphatase
MTAIVTGHKTNNGVISQKPPAEAGKDGEPLKTILEYAEERGLATGVVSNSPMWDATPAACYAHANSRKKTGEIFQQVWKPRFGDGVDVIIGPGRPAITKALAEMGLDLTKGLTSAGLPLYETIAAAPREARRAVVLFDNAEFDLDEAANKAIEILSRNSKGFFLMVECDVHTDNAKRGLDRLVAFDRTIERIANRMAKNTLILFTADHSFDIRVQAGRRGDAVGLPEKATSRTATQRLPATDVRVDNSHTGEEVMVAARGPGSERVRGVLANTDLFHIMMSAFGWKPNDTARR